jgi:hypothetical protein
MSPASTIGHGRLTGPLGMVAWSALVTKGGTEMGSRLAARGCGQGTGTIHQGIPFFYFFIFSLLHNFFSIFNTKLESTTLN